MPKECWLNGWVSAWPDEQLQSPGTAVVRCRTQARVAKSLFPAVGLWSLPEVLVEQLTVVILKNDVKGSRWARTCKAHFNMSMGARIQLERDEFAWWTGDGLPMQAPSKSNSPPLPLRVFTGAQLGFYVKGLQPEDIDAIHTGWLTNFSIDALLVALRCPVVCEPYVVTSSLSGSTLVLSAGLSSMTQSALMQWGDQSGCLWGQAIVRQRIRDANILILPLNIGNNHWATIRINKEHNLVELFDSLSTAGDCVQDLVELGALLNILTRVGVEGASNFKRIAHTHAAWKQTDGAACGIFCCLTIASLVRGLRINIKQDDIAAWRSALGAYVSDFMHFGGVVSPLL